MQEHARHRVDREQTDQCDGQADGASDKGVALDPATPRQPLAQEHETGDGHHERAIAEARLPARQRTKHTRKR